MSYKTNPIANRLSINKGFVNTFFPNNKAAYGQYLILWLSLYLFLKSYLAFKKIKLLTCEIRMVSNTHKILYLSFLKIPKKIKNKKKIWRRNLAKSQLNKFRNRGAIFFIYQQWKKIKKWIFITKKKNKKKFKLYYKKMINSLSSFKKHKLLSGLKNKKIIQSFFVSRLNKPVLSSSNLNIINLRIAALKFKNIKYQLDVWKRIYPYFLNDMNFKNLLINMWFLRKLNRLNKKQKKIKRLKKKFIKNHLKFIKVKRFIYQSKKKIYKKMLIKLYFSLKKLYAKKNRYFVAKKKSRKNHILYKKWKLLYTQNKNYLYHFHFYKEQNIKLIHLYFFYSLKKNQRIQFKTLKKYMYRSPQLIKRLLYAQKKKK